MPIRRVRPTSAGTRQITFLDNSDLTRGKRPEKRLTKALAKSGGRNNHGRVTMRHIGGGHKRKYRIVDWKRDKDGIPAVVASIEYDPNRNARLALLHYADGEKRYVLAPLGIEVGHKFLSGSTAEAKPGNCLSLRAIPVGLTIHALEIVPGRGAPVQGSSGIPAWRHSLTTAQRLIG